MFNSALDHRRASIGLLVLRVVAGALLAVHGFQKLPDVGQFVGGVEKMGVPLPAVAGWLVILGEVVLGILIVVGVATRVVGALTALMFASIWSVVHSSPLVLADQPGVNGETALLYLFIGVLLAFTGSGRFALDAVLSRRSAEALT